MTDLAGEFADRLREELDFRLEARNATEIAAAIAATDQVHVPAVHGELSTARCWSTAASTPTPTPATCSSWRTAGWG
jgi:hypothetical protein